MKSAQYLIIAIILMVAVAGGYFLLKGGMTSTSASGLTTGNQPNSSAGGDSQKVQTASVDYTDSGFSPHLITVKAGTTVTFTNKASDNFWVASNPHPTHTDLPGFDAKRNIAPGDSYSFTFTKVGRWGYHNHLNPSEGGTVVVQ